MTVYHFANSFNFIKRWILAIYVKDYLHDTRHICKFNERKWGLISKSIFRRDNWGTFDIEYKNLSEKWITIIFIWRIIRSIAQLKNIIANVEINFSRTAWKNILENNIVYINYDCKLRNRMHWRFPLLKKKLGITLLITVGRRGTINCQSKDFTILAILELDEKSFNIYYKTLVIHRESLAAVLVTTVDKAHLRIVERSIDYLYSVKNMQHSSIYFTFFGNCTKRILNF